jgi:hypothetical protein
MCRVLSRTSSTNILHGNYTGRPRIASFTKWCYGDHGGWLCLQSQLCDSVC